MFFFFKINLLKNTFYTVLSVCFPFLCTGKLQYIECTICVHIPDFYFRSIAGHITVNIPYFFLTYKCTEHFR